MIKVFCDNCEKQISVERPNAIAPGKYLFEKKKFRFRLNVSIGGECWGGGHLCEECVRELINKSSMVPDK